MLARPEIGSRQHILLWLAGKPADETYDWRQEHDCACGQYAQEHLVDPWTWVGDRRHVLLWEMNVIAGSCKTFGQLSERLRKEWE